jgi:hypothetical protein
MVFVSLDTPMAAIPENAAITITISDAVNRDLQDAYRLAAQANNQQIGDTAYNVYIGKTNMVTTGPAMVVLTISPVWVTNHGGIPSIRIAHLSDDGAPAILMTDYTGSDDRQNLVFQGSSPQGLSTFSLVSMVDLAGSAQAQPETPAPALSSTNPFDLIRNIAGDSGRFILNNIVLVVGGCIILLLMVTGVIIYDLRSAKKKKPNRKKNQ